MVARPTASLVKAPPPIADAEHFVEAVRNPNRKVVHSVRMLRQTRGNNIDAPVLHPFIHLIVVHLDLGLNVDSQVALLRLL